MNLTTKGFLRILLISILPMGLLVSSCSKSAPDKNGGAAPENRRLVGTLEKNVESMGVDSDDLNQSECDKLFYDKKLEIARELDKKADSLKLFYQQNSKENSKYKLVTVGPASFKQPLSDDKGEDKWIPDIVSWKEQIANFEKIKSSGLSTDWLELDSQVRSLLLDDEDRIVYWRNKDISVNDRAMVEELLGAAQVCLDTPDCISPQLDTDLEKFVNRIPLYASYVDAIKNSEVHSDILKQFLARLHNDHRRFEFHNETTVKRLDAKTVEVKLDVGDFAGAESSIESEISKVWSSTEDLKIKIHWLKNSDSGVNAFYKFLYLPDFGSRSYVNWTDRTVTIFPLRWIRSLSHEFGHVLGFNDKYDAVFQRESCGYDYAYNPGDLMSDSNHGNVTKDEVTELLKEYPLVSP